MTMEAQHLIDISLAKITQARFCRGGSSLHKNLLVATVLQKAKFMFMEEISHMVNHYYPRRKLEGDLNDNSDNDIDIMEGDERDSDDETDGPITPYEIHSKMEQSKCVDEKEKKNSSPTNNETKHLATYFDLDKNQIQKWRRNSLKRRKDIEIKSSTSSSSSSLSDDDDVIVKRNKYDNTENISPSSREEDCDGTENSNITNEDDNVENSRTSTSSSQSRSVDIERITSLVSIFNFTGLSTSKSNELCSSQATINTERENSISQHTYLAMTV